ncbi:MAG TPA: hypothetical protein VFZ34_00090, partial [Blastocatellia bacterium]|nr:hypothetical protein [Blastocatellia bacterium]
GRPPFVRGGRTGRCGLMSCQSSSDISRKVVILRVYLGNFGFRTRFKEEEEIKRQKANCKRQKVGTLFSFGYDEGF